MAEIRFLERKEIDDSKWNICLENSVNPFIYAYSWYLDALCNEQWAALVYGDYEAVFPLPWRKKYFIPYIYQPFFCQQLGLFAPDNLTLSQMDFIDKIPAKFKLVHLQINHYFPFPHGLKEKRNFVLNLYRSYAEIYAGYNADAKRNIKIASVPEIVFEENIPFEEVIEQNRDTWGRLNDKIKNKHYKNFEIACQKALERKQLITIRASVNNTVLGSALFMKTPRFIHYIMGSANVEGRKYSMMHGILNYVIKKYANTPTIFDFEGSEIPKVAEFYRKFGPTITAYSEFYSKLNLFRK